jgi:DNA-binding response OmpR family regulator
MNPTGHILIIDDEAALRQTLARVLQRAGFEVTTAASGEEGLASLAAAHVDLVYMDIRMPSMSGLEALKRIHGEHPSLPVVLFTAQPDLNSAVEALRYGAVDYLLKPLKPQMLIERTKTILAKQEKERRKRQIESQIESLQTELKGLEGNGKDQAPAVLQANAPDERFLQRGKMTIDLHARRLTIGERLINLPPTSFDYLVVLARHAPNVVDCQTLVAEAQGYEADAREAQELTKWHIHHIRQAIEPDARDPVHVINVRGTGYRLVGD